MCDYPQSKDSVSQNQGRGRHAKEQIKRGNMRGMKQQPCRNTFLTETLLMRWLMAAWCQRFIRLWVSVGQRGRGRGNGPGRGRGMLNKNKKMRGKPWTGRGRGRGGDQGMDDAAPVSLSWKIQRFSVFRTEFLGLKCKHNKLDIYFLLFLVNYQQMRNHLSLSRSLSFLFPFFRMEKVVFRRNG